MLTFEELKERIAERTDEVMILELLEINSFDLVEAFEERIENMYEKLIEEYDD